MYAESLAWGLWLSGKVSKASKRDVLSSTRGGSCFSLVFINNLINNKSKHKNFFLLFMLYCPGSLTIIYNMY